jgi:hypothetical protein
MSGTIIQFGDIRRSKPSTGHYLPMRNVDVASKPATGAFPSSLSRRRVLSLQVTRIARLLEELEELCLTRECDELGVVDQSRAGIEKVRAILRQWPEPEQNVRGSRDGGDDPQPDVDGDMLERMYQALNPDA